MKTINYCTYLPAEKARISEYGTMLLNTKDSHDQLHSLLVT
jgi:hypothetical protein